MKRIIISACLASMTLLANAQNSFIVSTSKDIITHLQPKSLTFENIGSDYVLSGTDILSGDISEIKKACEAQMELGVSEVTSYGCNATVINGYDTPKYFTMILPSEELADCVSADDYYQLAYDGWQSIADAYYLTVEEYLMYYNVLGEDNIEESYIGNLDYDTEYTIFAFGCDDMGERLTPVNCISFKTLPMTKYEVDFDIELKVEGKRAKMTVTPSDDTVPYYRGILDENTIKKYGNPTVEENILAYLKDMLGFFGLDPEDFMKHTCRIGISEYSDNDLDILSTAYAFAFATDPAINLCSPMKIVEFETGEIIDSDNQITTTIVGPSMYQAFVTFTPSNNDSYIGVVMKEEEIEGKSDAEIVEFLEQNTTNIFGLTGPFALYDTYSEFNPTTLIVSKMGFKPGDELVAISFGYEIEYWKSDTKGKATTELVKIPFKLATDPISASEQGYNFESHIYKGDGADMVVMSLQSEIPVYYGFVKADQTEEDIKSLIEEEAKIAEKSTEEYLLSKAKISYGDIPNPEALYFLLRGGKSIEYFEGMTIEELEAMGIYIIEPDNDYKVFAVSLNNDGSYAQPIHFSDIINVAQ